jgi:hypothetical protein
MTRMIAQRRAPARSGRLLAAAVDLRLVVPAAVCLQTRAPASTL